MKILKIYFVTVSIVLYLTTSVFSQEHLEEQNLTHEEIITQIMELSGHNVQIPQVADSIIDREDIKEYLSTLSQENREILEKEISMAFDANTMLEVIKDEIGQTLSEEEGRELLKWYVTDDAKAMTAMEETPEYKEDWEEKDRTKKDPKPDAKRLKLYESMLIALDYKRHAANEQIMLHRFLMGLIRQDMKGYKIENYLKKERKNIEKEIWEGALLDLSYDLASVEDEVLLRYFAFLASPAARKYQDARSIGLIRAISFAGDKVLSRAEELIVKYPYPSLSDLHPKSDKLKTYKEGCENGDMQACCDLGYAYRKGIGVERNYYKSLTALKMSCEGGISKGCGVLGDMYSRGLGVKQNHTKAVDYFQRSCDMGNVLGCGNLGVNYSIGLGVPKDQKKANSYFIKACNAGEEMACRNMGNQYKHGYGVIQDHTKAREYYEKACEGGNLSSCYYAGMYYASGEGVRQDYKRAKELFEISCKRKYSYACDMVADIYLEGKGTEKNVKEAIKYYTKSCNMSNNSKNGYGCYNLGMIYAEGVGIKEDIAKAKKFFKKAYDHGYHFSCTLYKSVDISN